MLTFYDCDLAVGDSGTGLKTPATPDAALAVMDYYSIGKAFAYDRAAMEAGIFDRFDEILSFCSRAGGRLFPTIPVAPPGCGEAPPPDELVELILRHGIKGVRLWPDYYIYDADPFTFGPLFERLEAHAVPVFVHLSEIHVWTRRGGWREVRETAQAFPRLPLVVLWSGMRDGRRLFPLMEQCPNVIADLTCLTYQFIEYAADHWGPDRLVFASHHPMFDPGIFTPVVLYSGVAPAVREQIAWRTAARLAEGVR